MEELDEVSEGENSDDQFKSDHKTNPLTTSYAGTIPQTDDDDDPYANVVQVPKDKQSSSRPPQSKMSSKERLLSQ